MSTQFKNSTQFVNFGSFELASIHCGTFLLDGGAMFGVVPKTLWSRQIPADEKNRILMAMRSLLIRSKKTGRLYLVDNGSGDKFNEKMTRIYGLDYSSVNLFQSLKNAGTDPEEITDIIFTHLHFDHCGGTTSFGEDGSLLHNFPNAAYHVHERHWQTATHPNMREKASFLKENIVPIGDSGRLNLTNDSTCFEDGLSVLMAEGHTEGQQLPLLRELHDSEHLDRELHEQELPHNEAEFQNNGRSLLFAGDLIPTHVHVPLPWVMGYDMKPLVTLREKETFLKAFSEQGTYLFLEHDATEEIIQIGASDGSFYVSNKLTLKDLETE